MTEYLLQTAVGLFLIGVIALFLGWYNRRRVRKAERALDRHVKKYAVLGHCPGCQRVVHSYCSSVETDVAIIDYHKCPVCNYSWDEVI